MDELATNDASHRLARLLPHLDAFVGFARKRVGNPALAEDIVQDALVKALAHAREVRDDERLEAWFYRILRRTIADLGSRRDRNAGPVPLDEPAANEEDHAVACACLNKLIDDLDSDQRDAVLLVDLQGVSATAAAQRLGITETNLKVRRHRARERLHQMLGEVCRMCAKHGCLDCHCQTRQPQP